MGIISRYVDLMAFRTPGKAIARHADAAGNRLARVAGDLPTLDNLGKSLPNDVIFSGWNDRLNAGWSFNRAISRFTTAADSARRFSISDGEGSLSFAASEASSAYRSATGIQRQAFFGKLPERMGDNVDTAVRRGRSAERTLVDAQYASYPSRRKTAAIDAFGDLKTGEALLRDARRGLEDLLSPFRGHDELRLRSQRSTRSAAEHAVKASGVDGVSESTRQLGSTSATEARTAYQAMRSLSPGGDISGVRSGVDNAVKSLTSLSEAGRAEPKPKNFGLQVAAAYGATVAVPASIAGGIYFAATRGND